MRLCICVIIPAQALRLSPMGTVATRVYLRDKEGYGALRAIVLVKLTIHGGLLEPSYPIIGTIPGS